MPENDPSRQRLATRVEAFSDLVFGFSLSLLATRLDVPRSAEAAEVFGVGRIVPLAVTFGLICILWLEHYRVFRIGFPGAVIDIVVNFIFLFAVATLPYALHTFLRYATAKAPLQLYLGSLALLFLSLATLQWRALWKAGPATAVPLWNVTVRRILTKYLVSIVAIVLIMLLSLDAVAAATLGAAFPAMVAATVIAARLLSRFAYRTTGR